MKTLACVADDSESNICFFMFSWEEDSFKSINNVKKENLA